DDLVRPHGNRSHALWYLPRESDTGAFQSKVSQQNRLLGGHRVEQWVADHTFGFSKRAGWQGVTVPVEQNYVLLRQGCAHRKIRGRSDDLNRFALRRISYRTTIEKVSD